MHSYTIDPEILVLPLLVNEVTLSFNNETGRKYFNIH